MDVEQYQKEIDMIQQESFDLDRPDNPSTVSKTTSTGKLAVLIKYKMYIIICILAMVFLYIVKPKYTLKVVKSGEGDVYEMVIDKKKFAICWIGTSVLFCLVYMFMTKKKNGSK